MAPSNSTDSRSQAFGYVCRHCTRCCRDKDVRVNPYETARLAGNLGLTTAEFRAARTRDGAGIMLGHTDTGACTFLDVESGSCSVYQDRPLVCRIFPLGWELLADGSERYFPAEGKPGGTFTQEGTVGGFLDAQGVSPFARAANEYFDWLRKVAQHLGTDSFVTSRLDSSGAAMAAALVDIDAAGAPSGVPGMAADLEERKQRHLAFLDRTLDEHMSIAQGDQPDQVEQAAALRRLLLATASMLAACLGVVPGEGANANTA